MKRATKLLAIILAAITAFAMPFYSYAFTSKSIFTSSTYTHQDRFADRTIVQGIDVSTHNGDIDWAKVKAAGVDFAIIRVGCRGYGSGGTLMKDDHLEKNLEGAHAQGISIGVYFYSQALNVTEAAEEANYVLKYISPYKSYLSLPVYFDYEFAEVSSGRLDSAWNSGKLNKTKMTNNAKSFCTTIQNAGYTAGLYSSKDFLYNKYNYTTLEKLYDVWLAHYTTNTDYKGEFRLWQFSSKGTISGIKGYVDSNFMYFDTKTTFDDITIDKQLYTGSAITPQLNVTYGGKQLVLNTDYTLTYLYNTDYGLAGVTVTGINSYAALTPRTYSFEIVTDSVKDLKVVSRTASTISISWSKNTSADGYRIEYLDGTKWTVSGETTDNSFTVSELKGGTAYKIRVCAYKISAADSLNYYSKPSEELTAPTSPVKVTGVKNYARTPTTLTLTWTKQTGATKYIIYKYNSSTKKYEKLGSTKKLTYKVKKLSANKAYKFKVRAITDFSDGTEQIGALSAVFKDYTSVKAPAIVSAKSNSIKHITAKWKTVSGATGYQVIWSTTSNFSSNYKTKRVAGKSKVSKTVKTARSGGSYYVKVRAYVKRSGKYYYSPWSKSIHLYTK